MSEYGKIRKQLMTDIAAAIREKKATTAIFSPAQMATEIRGIVTGDNLPDAERALFGTSSEEPTPEYGIRSMGSVSTLSYDIHAGYRFTVAEAFQILGIRIYNRLYAGNKKLYLWDANNALIKEITVIALQKQWTEGLFDEPINLMAGETYIVSAPGCTYDTDPANVTITPKIKDVVPLYEKTSNVTAAAPPTSSDGWFKGIVDIIIGPPVTESTPTEYKIQTETMDGLADAIREKAGVDATLTPAEMTAIVNAMESVQSAKGVLF